MPRQQALLKLYRQLITQRDELCRHLDADISHAGDTGIGLGDAADNANDDVEREISSQLASLESRELDRIEAAILAIQEGRYGTCEECQKSIPVARLQALPHSTTCIECQRLDERGVRKRGVRENWATAYRAEVRADTEVSLENLIIPLER